MKSLMALRMSALACLVVVTCVGGVDPAGAQPARSDGRGRCAQLYAAGLSTLTVQSRGRARSLKLFVPTSYDGRRRLPLLLNLHASQENPDDQLQITELAATAESEGFVLATMQAGIDSRFIEDRPGFVWNVPGFPQSFPAGTERPDDEQYLIDSIDTLQSILCLDAGRVYGTGYSGGARMISQFACDHADRIAAIAPVAGLRAGGPLEGSDPPQPDLSLCRPSRPMPIIAFHGTADPVNTYGDGGLTSWRYGVEKALDRWAVLNRCASPRRTTQVTEDVARVGYAGCRHGASVNLYRVTGAGHTWPGSSTCVALPYELCGPGTSTNEISANDLMWRFMSKYRLSTS